MGMPQIPDRDADKVCIDLLESIALEETALAHLINAEAEKLQHALCMKLCPDELKKIQASVIKVMRTAIKMQILLQFKLEDVMEMCEEDKKPKRKKCWVVEE